MNIVKQPLPIALLTLIGLASMAIFLSDGFLLSGGVEAESLTPLAQWIEGWQEGHPLTARLLALFLVITEALMIARIGTRHSLYSGGSPISMPLFALTALGVLQSPNELTGILGALLLVRALRNFSASARNGYTFTPLFRGALYLGLLPLLHAPALLLIPLSGCALILFRRTLREGIITLGGLLLPLGSACYLSWAFGGNLEAPLMQITSILSQAPRLPLFERASFLLILQLLILLSASLCALFFLSSRYNATKARSILSLFSWGYILSLAMLLTRGATANLFPLVAVPTTLLLPYLFVRLRPLYANTLYGALILCFLLRLLL